MARPTVENREAIYDEQINPLMAQIISICQTNRISMIASFHTPNADDPNFFCSTALTAHPDTPAPLKRALGVLLQREAQAFAITVSSPRGRT